MPGLSKADALRVGEGKLSLSTLADKLGLSVSETIDLLSEFGVESPLDYDDYLKGFEVFKK